MLGFEGAGALHVKAHIALTILDVFVKNPRRRRAHGAAEAHFPSFSECFCRRICNGGLHRRMDGGEALEGDWRWVERRCEHGLVLEQGQSDGIVSSEFLTELVLTEVATMPSFWLCAGINPSSHRLSTHHQRPSTAATPTIRRSKQPQTLRRQKHSENDGKCASAALCALRRCGFCANTPKMIRGMCASTWSACAPSKPIQTLPFLPKRPFRGAQGGALHDQRGREHQKSRLLPHRGGQSL